MKETTSNFDELEKLAKKPVVFAPDGPFEKPAAVTPGRLYTTADERLPELADEASDRLEVGKDRAATEVMPEVRGNFDRRDLLKLFTVSSLAGATSCVRRPVEKAIPHVNQPIDTVVGMPVDYATTCGGCPSGCGVISRTREGRPTKLEGYDKHSVNQGGLCSLGQASILDLYHPERRPGPMVRHGKRLDLSTWDKVLPELAKKVGSAKKVAILTNGSTGHRNDFLRAFLKKAGMSADSLYTYEPDSLYAATSEAYDQAFGRDVIPRMDFDQLEMLVGVGTDFLESSVSAAKGFTRFHAYDHKRGEKNRFVQFEAAASLTGTKAEKRFVIPPGSELITTLLIMRALFENKNSKGTSFERKVILDILNSKLSALYAGYKEIGVTKADFDKLAVEMIEKRSAVLVGGSSNFDESMTVLQLAAICCNILIGAYDKILRLDEGWHPSPVKAGDMSRFQVDAKNIDLLFVVDTNPVFTTPSSWQMTELLEKIPTVVSVQSFPNETDQFAKFVLPNHHYLEAWGDEQPVAGYWSIRQPTVRPLTDSRQAEDVLLWVLAHMDRPLGYADYRSYLQEQWVKDLRGFAPAGIKQDTFVKALQRNGYIGKPRKASRPRFRDTTKLFAGDLGPKSKGLVLQAPFDVRLGDGRGAHLPLLQEVGDPMTTVAWDSFVGLNPNTMKSMGLKRNQVVRVKSSAGSLEAAVYPVPGLHPQAVSIARGNGHQGGHDGASKVSAGVGVDPLVLVPRTVDKLSGQPATSLVAVTVTATGKWHRLAAMQKSHDIGDRHDVVRRHTVKEMRKLKRKVDLDDVPDLYNELPSAEHRWGLSIDLERCFGCGACMTACSVENNIPQAGREQVLLGREMHWVRLDHYYEGDLNNPKVTFQPVMCQHCNHAPCEAVCPVFATTHDPEGLNAMTYNRCVGTRYCGNACPYKVRRFNWWTHKWGTLGDRPQDFSVRAVNPDVTVRTRGVMEKCSMCVGRLREGRLLAKKEDRPVFDGEIKTACQQTCPADAITFGNLNDSRSAITQARMHPRAYLMLGGEPDHGHYGLKTLPNVNYLADVGDTPSSGGHGDDHGHGGGHH